MRVQIDVWSDYVCPFCYLEEPVLERIAEGYGERVRIDWRPFELRPTLCQHSNRIAHTFATSGPAQFTRWPWNEG